MNILLIGSGGREHAMARALLMSESCGVLFAAPGNPGIFRDAKMAEIDVNDHGAVARFCRQNEVDLVVVGPEQPLADGIADALRSEGIAVFGPSANAARLESSKGFAKDFMRRHSIPTAAFQVFGAEDKEAAHDYVDSLMMPVVLKADGLAAGKGVIICSEKRYAHDTLDKIFGGLFGDAGSSVVVEEYMEGEEASILAISDGQDYVLLASSQDHKRALDDDKGPNTGGMGAYAPAPLVTDNVLMKVEQQIIGPAIKGMAEEGNPFVGCLYAGLMISGGEPRVVEFNVRLGDPEAQAVLSVFRGDFAKLLHTSAIGNIDKTAVQNECEGAACCIILASAGYPGSYQKGFEILGIGEAEAEGAIVYHAGTKTKDGTLVTNGGRVLGVTQKAESLAEAIDGAYKAVSKVRFDNRYFRNDIGRKALS